MEFECYSQRLLNPFRGITNTIRHASAEAVTADGVHWDIYVSNEALQRDLPAGRRAQVSDIRYGRWSSARGLKRGPILSSADFLAMEAMGDRVYEHLLAVHDQVPFPFTDIHELWLLDQAGRPLALLDSAPEITQVRLDQPCQWRPGLSCRDSFTSAAAAELQLDATQPGVVTDYLSTYVNARTADQASAQLFRREADGSGTGLAGINLDPALEGRNLTRDEFPLLLLDTQAADTPHRRLLHDFTCWQAPWLLLLPTLDSGLRREYETHARVQAVKLADQHALYPEIIDRTVIDAARIEARLRRTVTEPEARERVLSPFYIELESD